MPRECRPQDHAGVAILQNSHGALTAATVNKHSSSNVRHGASYGRPPRLLGL